MFKEYVIKQMLDADNHTQKLDTTTADAPQPVSVDADQPFTTIIDNTGTHEKIVKEEQSSEGKIKPASDISIDVFISEGKAWLSLQQIEKLYKRAFQSDNVDNQLAKIKKFTSVKGPKHDSEEGNEPMVKYYDVYDVLSLLHFYNHIKQDFAKWLRGIQGEIDATLTTEIRAGIFNARLGGELSVGTKKRTEIREKSWNHVFCSPTCTTASTYVSIMAAVVSTFSSLYKPSYASSDKDDKTLAIILAVVELATLGLFLWLQFRDNHEIIRQLEKLHERLRLMYPDSYKQAQIDKKVKEETVIKVVDVTGVPKCNDFTKQSPAIIAGAVLGAASFVSFFRQQENSSRILGAIAPIASSAINTFINKRLTLELSVTKSIINAENDEEANLISEHKLS